jgi:hypothetical protein
VEESVKIFSLWRRNRPSKHKSPQETTIEKLYIFIGGPLDGKEKKYSPLSGPIDSIAVPSIGSEGLEYMMYYRQTVRDEAGVRDVFVFGGLSIDDLKSYESLLREAVK